MAFNQGAANGINRPDNWFGIGTFTQSNGTERTAWDGAHATGDSLWNREMSGFADSYQSKLGITVTVY